MSSFFRKKLRFLFFSGSTSKQLRDTTGGSDLGSSSVNSQPESGTSTVAQQKIQEGGGLTSLLHNTTLVNQLTEAVLKNIHAKSASVTPRWQNYERVEPTVIVETLTETTPPLPFSTPIFDTDLNDSFDEQKLLKTVPKSFKKNASELLKQFDARPNEITWDSAGHIYIDEVSIPNANIFVLFPQLFKKRNSKKNLEGFDDFLKQINSMGLTHLIRDGKKHPSQFQKNQSQPQTNEVLTPAENSANWWFLGE